MKTYEERVSEELLRKASALRTAPRTAPLTPQEFAEKMRSIKRDYDGDTECLHGALDEAMEDLLVSLGYSDGINIAKKCPRWYA